ncbi:hypothetical protein V6B14_23215 (plasmid) [Sporosarcina psychrophila]|uniref:hypothetical protein n=1 Tax=Sporosarcina psychrophila TaxID=1476 RepID=UPI0030D0C02D
MDNPLDALNFNEPLFMFIRVIQMILVPLFGIMALIGLFLFLYSFKNPIKRRSAFLFCVFSPIGFVLFLHGAPLLDYYVYSSPNTNDGGQGLEVMVGWVEKFGAPVYTIFDYLMKPLLVSLLIIGLGFLHASGKTPGLKRLGTGVLVGVPFLWFLLELGPTIYNIFLS